MRVDLEPLFRMLTKKSNFADNFNDQKIENERVDLT